jgi:hypothetical protein
VDALVLRVEPPAPEHFYRELGVDFGIVDDEYLDRPAHCVVRSGEDRLIIMSLVIPASARTSAAAVVEKRGASPLLSRVCVILEPPCQS